MKDNNSKPEEFTITPGEMEEVVKEDDFNEALIVVQHFIGQPYGDVAAQHFSSRSDDELKEMWAAASNREQVILDYLKAESQYSKL